MKAVIITQYGAAEYLQIQHREKPEIKADEVLIEVYAAGINRPDLFQRKGNYPAPAGVPADIPGLEVAGIISAIGPQVTEWKVGDAVCALVAGAGYANYVQVHQSHCIAIPEGYSMEEAACIPETVFTVYSNVFMRAGLQSGQSLLVYGGSGGIGSTAIQMAKIAGARVLTLAGSADKVAFCKQLGADRVINYKQEDIETAFEAEKIQVILDSIGGNYFPINMKLLQEDGHLVYINATSGAQVALNIFQLMQKRIHLSGSTLRGRDITFKAEVRNQLLAFNQQYNFFKQFKPAIFNVFDWTEVVSAHKLLEEGDFMGKLVLQIKKS